MKKLICSVSFLLAVGTALQAQNDPKPFSFQIGGGFTTPIGRSGSYLDYGWNATAGLGVNFGSYVGAMVDLGYSHMGINSTTLTGIGVPGGDVSIFSATLDPIVHLNPHGHFDIYVTGGGGLFHRYQEFTQPTVATTFGYYPFFGFYPALVPATQVLASYSVNKPGFDAGIGIALGTKWHGKFYAEARYNEMFDGNGFHTAYIPVTFGFRW